MQDVRKCMKLLEVSEFRWTVAGRLRCVLHRPVLSRILTIIDSDLLTDLSAAGELTVPADSPPSNKREREDSDDEGSQSPSTPQIQPQPQHSASLGSTLYQPAPITQADASPLSARTGPAASSSSNGPYATVELEVQPNMSDNSVPPAPFDQATSVLVPKPYSGSYMPLYGSSGLGRATPATQSSGPAPFPTSSTMHGNSNRISPLTSGAGVTQPPGISMMLATNGLYNVATLAPPSAPASISSGASSPRNGFQPSADFGTSSAGAAMFDMNGMEMEFGGYGVPTADKEAMLRHFAPVLLQDGQIGVDRDTMMMWSTMPSTFECVTFLLFFAALR